MQPPPPRPATAAPPGFSMPSPGRGPAFKGHRDSLVWTQGVTDSGTAPQQAAEDDVLWTEGASDYDAAPPSLVATPTSSSSLSCASSSDQPTAGTIPSLPIADSPPAADPLRQAAAAAPHAADDPDRRHSNEHQLQPARLRGSPGGHHGCTSSRLEDVTPPSAQLPCHLEAASLQQEEAWADPAAAGSAVCECSPTPSTAVEPLPSAKQQFTPETISKESALHPAAPPRRPHPSIFRQQDPPCVAQAPANQQHLASASAAYSSIETVAGTAQPAVGSSSEDDQEECSLVFDDDGDSAALDDATGAQEASMAALSFNAAKSPDLNGGGAANKSAAAAAGEAKVPQGARPPPPARAAADHVGAPHGCLLRSGSRQINRSGCAHLVRCVVTRSFLMRPFGALTPGTVHGTQGAARCARGRPQRARDGTASFWSLCCRCLSDNFAALRYLCSAEAFIMRE